MQEFLAIFLLGKLDCGGVLEFLKNQPPKKPEKHSPRFLFHDGEFSPILYECMAYHHREAPKVLRHLAAVYVALHLLFYFLLIITLVCVASAAAAVIYFVWTEIFLSFDIGQTTTFV